MEPAHITHNMLMQVLKNTEAGVHRFDERCMQAEQQTKLGRKQLYRFFLWEPLTQPLFKLLEICTSILH
eukprot:1143834-Pelagomonas_calceolata.AAC.3